MLRAILVNTPDYCLRHSHLHLFLAAVNFRSVNGGPSGEKGGVVVPNSNRTVGRIRENEYL